MRYIFQIVNKIYVHRNYRILLKYVILNVLHYKAQFYNKS